MTRILSVLGALVVLLLFLDPALAEVVTSSVAGADPRPDDGIPLLLWALRNGEVLIAVGAGIGLVIGIARYLKVNSWFDGWPGVAIGVGLSFLGAFSGALLLGQGLVSALGAGFEIALPALLGLFSPVNKPEGPEIEAA